MSGRMFCRGVVGGLLLAFLSSVGQSPAPAQEVKQTFPKQIILIRHAEKPLREAELVDLNEEGKKRAEALPELFKVTQKRPTALPLPEFIFATKNSKRSQRPLQTVTPLAQKLQMTIDSRFANEEYAKLADELFQNPKYAGKTILICWHHGTMPAFAEKLKVAPAPATIGAEVFDRVWKITYNDQGTATFTVLPQQLLPNDSDK